jgi:hypothetical protein
MREKKTDDGFSHKEAKERFEAALKSALNTPHKPLMDKPKVRRWRRKPNRRKSPASEAGILVSVERYETSVDPQLHR